MFHNRTTFNGNKYFLKVAKIILNESQTYYAKQLEGKT